MSYTIEDFERDYFKEHFAKLTPKERRKFLEALPPKDLQALPLEKRLAGLSVEQIREYLDRLTTGRRSEPHKRRKKNNT